MTFYSLLERASNSFLLLTVDCTVDRDSLDTVSEDVSFNGGFSVRWNATVTLTSMLHVTIIIAY